MIVLFMSLTAALIKESTLGFKMSGTKSLAGQWEALGESRSTFSFVKKVLSIGCRSRKGVRLNIGNCNILSTFRGVKLQFFVGSTKYSSFFESYRILWSISLRMLLGIKLSTMVFFNFNSLKVKKNSLPLLDCLKIVVSRL